jgi:hypothetical protein
MSKKPQSQPSDQGATFIRAARELGCDESEERFDAALKAVAKHKPTDEKTKARKKAKS